ncbi:hypothetical protein EJ06DRAFT_532589 [Trichodelitschia bisporula]|uniref:Uncharacterized protein n=1 Tax=Trichodelitschia bisporula TaxID=703511 RepID=A0A6G1HQV6_9PEZI|nr:hypothetical protein EJ06DRAFT_532589 [Trichodelitschia bisporula]
MTSDLDTQVKTLVARAVCSVPFPNTPSNPPRTTLERLRQQLEIAERTHLEVRQNIVTLSLAAPPLAENPADASHYPTRDASAMQNILLIAGLNTPFRSSKPGTPTTPIGGSGPGTSYFSPSAPGTASTPTISQGRKPYYAPKAPGEAYFHPPPPHQKSPLPSVMTDAVVVVRALDTYNRHAAVGLQSLKKRIEAEKARERHKGAGHARGNRRRVSAGAIGRTPRAGMARRTVSAAGPTSVPPPPPPHPSPGSPRLRRTDPLPDTFSRHAKADEPPPPPAAAAEDRTELPLDPRAVLPVGLDPRMNSARAAMLRGASPTDEEDMQLDEPRRLGISQPEEWWEARPRRDAERDVEARPRADVEWDVDCLIEKQKKAVSKQHEKWKKEEERRERSGKESGEVSEVDGMEGVEMTGPAVPVVPESVEMTGPAVPVVPESVEMAGSPVPEGVEMTGMAGSAVPAFRSVELSAERPSSREKEKSPGKGSPGKGKRSPGKGSGSPGKESGSPGKKTEESPGRKLNGEREVKAGGSVAFIDRGRDPRLRHYMGGGCL